MELFLRLQKHSETAPHDIKTTEGQHYRRGPGSRRRIRPRPGARRLGINDGKGFVFISHTGDIQPSGFLPITAGNVRQDELIDVYRNAPLFRNLRDTSRLEGKCGLCEFKNICGGSRARAFAMTGSPFGAEPLCAYQPRTHVHSTGLVPA